MKNYTTQLDAARRGIITRKRRRLPPREEEIRDPGEDLCCDSASKTL